MDTARKLWMAPPSAAATKGVGAPRGSPGRGNTPTEQRLLWSERQSEQSPQWPSKVGTTMSPGATSATPLPDAFHDPAAPGNPLFRVSLSYAVGSVKTESSPEKKTHPAASWPKILGKSAAKTREHHSFDGFRTSKFKFLRGAHEPPQHPKAG